MSEECRTGSLWRAEIFQSSKLLRATAQRQIWEGTVSSLTYSLFWSIYVISDVDMDSKKVGQRTVTSEHTTFAFRAHTKTPRLEGCGCDSSSQWRRE